MRTNLATTPARSDANGSRPLSAGRRSHEPGLIDRIRDSVIGDDVVLEVVEVDRAGTVLADRHELRD